MPLSQGHDIVGVGEEIVMEDNSAELFAEAQARAREQAAYEQLKASGMWNTLTLWEFKGW